MTIIIGENTFKALEALDSLQGDDKFILNVRESIPEPTCCNCFVINYVEPELPRCLDWSKLEYDPNLMDRLIVTNQFEKIILTVNGTKFFAWKSKKDGKIYI